MPSAAKRCAQYYMNQRWLGSTLTNWQTISHSIKRMRAIEELLSPRKARVGLKKKELLGLLRERDKLEKSLGGIREMGGLPNMLFVIDTNKEAIALSEAQKLGIPVTAIVDSNCDPDGIAYRSRAMTTPPARWSCIATCCARSSTASARVRPTLVSTSVRLGTSSSNLRPQAEAAEAPASA